VRTLECGSCSECCKGPRELELLPEDHGKYFEYHEEGKVFLMRKANEDCIYLEGGCSIYADRPETCRRFDCREHLDEAIPERVKIEALKRL